MSGTAFAFQVLSFPEGREFANRGVCSLRLEFMHAVCCLQSTDCRVQPKPFQERDAPADDTSRSPCLSHRLCARALPLQLSSPMSVTLTVTYRGKVTQISVMSLHFQHTFTYKKHMSKNPGIFANSDVMEFPCLKTLAIRGLARISSTCLPRSLQRRKCLHIHSSAMPCSRIAQASLRCIRTSLSRQFESILSMMNCPLFSAASTTVLRDKRVHSFGCMQAQKIEKKKVENSHHQLFQYWNRNRSRLLCLR